MPDRDIAGDALARILLDPFRDLLGDDHIDHVTFADLLPDLGSIADPTERADAARVHRLLVGLRDGIEAHRQAGHLP